MKRNEKILLFVLLFFFSCARVSNRWPAGRHRSGKKMREKVIKVLDSSEAEVLD